MGGSCSTSGGNEKIFRISLGKLEVKRPLRYLDLHEGIILKLILNR
jgi:hypothetical protein